MLHHIIIGGIERRAIFKDDFDRENYLARFYEIKSRGYTIEKVEKRVMEIFGVEKDVIYSKGRRRIQVAARSLLCYWAVRELGHAATELAKRLKMTQPAVSYAVIRGERIAKENSYTLVV